MTDGMSFDTWLPREGDGPDVDGDVFTEGAIQEIVGHATGAPVWLGNEHRFDQIAGLVTDARRSDLGISMTVAATPGPQGERLVELMDMIRTGDVGLTVGGRATSYNVVFRARWQRFLYAIVKRIKRTSVLRRAAPPLRWLIACGPPPGMNIERFTPLEFSVVPKDQLNRRR